MEKNTKITKLTETDKQTILRNSDKYTELYGEGYSKPSSIEISKNSNKEV